MRVWRGVFTKNSRDQVEASPFGLVESASEKVLPQVLVKILENSPVSEGEEKLTSFSKSRDVALRYAGFRGWLLEVEVPAAGLLDCEPYLERLRGTVVPATASYERISEALDMSRQDQEVFIVRGASYRIVAIHLVGGVEYPEEEE